MKRSFSKVSGWKMSEPVLDDDSPGWEIARIQMESDNQYSSDENIENSLSGGFNVNTQDFKPDFDAGLGTIWTTTHNQPDNFQKLPKYRTEKTNQVMDSQDTEMDDPGPLSRERRLSLGSDSTSEGLAPQPQRIGGFNSVSSPNFLKKMMSRTENIIPLSESPRRDQQQVMYVSH